jgi:hypothetical protein
LISHTTSKWDLTDGFMRLSNSNVTIRALVLFQITQEKRIADLFVPILELLQETLNAHRVALSIDQQNADVLFNTAQVLTTLAEELTDSGLDDKEMKPQATSFLQEAVELFAACLSRQEMDFTEVQSMQAAATEAAEEANDDEMDDGGAADAPDEDGPEQWATVIEPVTPSTLLDTALAQLQCLATLARIVAPTKSSMLANISELATPIADRKLPYYTSLLPTSVAIEDQPAAFLSVSTTSSSFHRDAPPQAQNPQASAKLDADLAIAHFSASLADAEFRSGLINVQAYHERIELAYQPLQADESPANPNDTIRKLYSYADALTEFAETLAESSARSSSSNDGQTHRWSALSAAQTLLTKATDLLKSGAVAHTAEGPSKAQVYLQRGDIDLHRYRLSRLPGATAAIGGGAGTLLKNAGVYYRGAAGLAVQDGNEDVAGEAGVKAGVVKLVEGTSEGGAVLDSRKLFPDFEADVVRGIMEDMIAEGLVDDDVRGLMGMA